jgi:hypothetical protein
VGVGEADLVAVARKPRREVAELHRAAGRHADRLEERVEAQERGLLPVALEVPVGARSAWVAKRIVRCSPEPAASATAFSPELALRAPVENLTAQRYPSCVASAARGGLVGSSAMIRRCGSLVYAEIARKP